MSANIGFTQYKLSYKVFIVTLLNVADMHACITSSIAKTRENILNEYNVKLF